MPAAELAVDWDADQLEPTAAAQSLLASYDPRRHDSALYCMPLGTPRNTLTTAPYPIEILQRPEQITMIFDGRGDVRRVFLDGRGHPAEPIPNWMGHSLGAWTGATLEVDTVAMTGESRLSSSGLPHSETMTVTEAWRLTERDGERLLHIVLRIDDAEMYARPLIAERYYRRTHAAVSETAGYCQMDQWRAYLERHSKELSLALQAIAPRADGP